MSSTFKSGRRRGTWTHMDAQFGCCEDIAEERILLEERDGYSAGLSL